MLDSSEGCCLLPNSWRLVFLPLKKIIIGALSVLLMSCREDPESFGAKSENSVLPVVAAKFPGASANALEFVDFDEYHFVRVRSGDESVWIMLNPRYTPFYKQIPWNRGFVITQQQFEEIDKKGTATLTVIHCLASHVASQP